jgi:hypothetical protein
MLVINARVQKTGLKLIASCQLMTVVYDFTRSKFKWILLIKIIF